MTPLADASLALSNCRAISESHHQATLLFPADLAVFSGHFPEQPLVPGVHLLAAAQALARIATKRADLRIAAIRRAKWTAPIVPDQVVDIDITIIQEADDLLVKATFSSAGANAGQAQILLSQAAAKASAPA